MIDKDSIQKPLEPEKNVNNFDIREKRLGIIFKVVYVISFFWLVSVTALFTMKRENLIVDFSTGMLFAVLATGVSIVLISLTRYVYNELKCLRIDIENETKNQQKHTETIYSQVFFDVKLGFGVSVILWTVYMIASTSYKFILTTEILNWIIGISLLVYILCLQFKDIRIIRFGNLSCTVFFYSLYTYILM